MSISDLLSAAGSLGLSGLLIAFIFWSEMNNRKDRRDQHADTMQAHKDATDANLQIARALEALKSFIMGGRGNV